MRTKDLLSRQPCVSMLFLDDAARGSGYTIERRDAVQRRNSLVTVIMVGALFVGGWWFVSRKIAIASPAALVTASPIPVTDRLNIEAGKGMTYSVTPPQGKVPGWLSGRWTCKGKSAGIKGAHDDSLVAFKIVGPDNKVIEKLDHQGCGNFKLRFDGPGAYTFVFDNSGIIRSSARVVEIDGTYQPD
jgi:hypothetical protein